VTGPKEQEESTFADRLPAEGLGTQQICRSFSFVVRSNRMRPASISTWRYMRRIPVRSTPRGVHVPQWVDITFLEHDLRTSLR